MAQWQSSASTHEIRSDTDLSSTHSKYFARVTSRSAVSSLRLAMDCSHVYQHQASAVQPNRFATDHIVGKKWRNATDWKKSPCRKVAPAINSASCLTARPSIDTCRGRRKRSKDSLPSAPAIRNSNNRSSFGCIIRVSEPTQERWVGSRSFSGLHLYRFKSGLTASM